MKFALDYAHRAVRSPDWKEAREYVYTTFTKIKSNQIDQNIWRAGQIKEFCGDWYISILSQTQPIWYYKHNYRHSFVFLPLPKKKIKKKILKQRKFYYFASRLPPLICVPLPGTHHSWVSRCIHLQPCPDRYTPPDTVPLHLSVPWLRYWTESS